MRGIYTLVGVGVLTACLASWAALAWAQPTLGKLPPTDSPAPDSGAVQPAGGSAGAPASGQPSSKPGEPGPAQPKSAEPVPAPAAAEAGPAPAPKAGEGTPAVPGPVAGPPGLPPTPSAKPAPSPVPATLPTPGTLTGGQAEPPAPAGASGTGTGPAAPGATGSAPPAFGAAGGLPDERPVEPTATPDNTTGRQEPAISLEWVGSPTAKVGQATEYTLVVRNACNIPVQQVLVRVRMPAGIRVEATEPRVTPDNNILAWELGTLMAKQEKVLQMKLVAEARGDVMPQAWVTFTGSSVMRIKVREPKLVLKAQAPEKVLVGDPAAFTLTVTNPGDGSADQVKIHATLSEGLEHARGNKIDFEIGNLAAGESRNVTLLCATKTGGVQKCEAAAEADGGLSSKDAASVNVSMPRLEMHLTGPGLRYLERKAIYVLKVTNPGDAPATNVTVADMVPDGFQVLAASDGGRHDFQTRTVSWFLGEIAAGQTREVKLEVKAINPGEHHHKASAVGARGLRAEAELMTRVEGLSALALEMRDIEDPIEVNGDTGYEVTITNTGSKTETDIKLVATIPEKMEFKSAQGPNQGPARFREEGKTIVFEPLERLAPQANAIYRINVKALDPGTVRFKIQVTSTNLVDPVIKMEPTRIYSDAPEPPSKGAGQQEQ